MKLSIIIPRYDNNMEIAENTSRNLRTIRHVAKGDTEIVIVDNGSQIPFKDQEIVDIYERWPENRGIAPAWNYGWKVSTGDYLCFMNTDVTVHSGWDVSLIGAASHHEVIAMPYTNGEKSDGIGITGWCFLTSRNVADRIGPFDETFVPAYYEDTDWFHRAIFEYGIPLINVPTANVLHTRSQGGTTTAPWIAQRDLLFVANRYRYAWKHAQDPTLAPPFWKQAIPEIDVEMSQNDNSQV